MDKTYNIDNLGSHNLDTLQIQVFVPEPGGNSALKLLLKREDGSVLTLDDGMTAHNLAYMAQRLSSLASMMECLDENARRMANAMGDLAHWEEKAATTTTGVEPASIISALFD